MQSTPTNDNSISVFSFFKKYKQITSDKKITYHGMYYSFAVQFPGKISQEDFFKNIAQSLGGSADDWDAIPEDLNALRAASSTFRKEVRLTAILDKCEYRVIFNGGAEDNSAPLEILLTLNDKVGEFYPYKNRKLPQDFLDFISNFRFNEHLIDKNLHNQLKNIKNKIDQNELKKWVAKEKKPPESYIKAREASMAMDLWELYAAAKMYDKRIYLVTIIDGQTHVVDINSNGNHAKDGTPIKLLFTCNLNISSSSLLKHEKEEISSNSREYFHQDKAKMPLSPSMPTMTPTLHHQQLKEENALGKDLEQIALNGCRAIVFGDTQGKVRDRLLGNLPLRTTSTILNIHRFQYPIRPTFTSIEPSQISSTSTLEDHRYKYEPLTMSLWHFSGNPERYRYSHTLFLSDNTLYIIAVDGDKIDRNEELSNVILWVDSIKETAGNAPIIIVASNTEKLNQEVFDEFKNSIYRYISDYNSELFKHIVDNNEQMNQVLYDEALKLAQKPPENFTKMQKYLFKYFNSQQPKYQEAGICKKSNLFEDMKKELIVEDQQIEAFLKFMHDQGHLLNNAKLKYIFYRQEILCAFIDKIINYHDNPLNDFEFDFITRGILSDYMLNKFVRSSFYCLGADEVNEVANDLKMLISHANIGIPGRFELSSNANNNELADSLLIPWIKPLANSQISTIEQKKKGFGSNILNLRIPIGMAPENKVYANIISNLLMQKLTFYYFYPTACIFKLADDNSSTVIDISQKTVRIMTEGTKDPKNKGKFNRLLSIVNAVEAAFRKCKLELIFITSKCFSCSIEKIIFSKSMEENFCRPCNSNFATNSKLTTKEIEDTEVVVFVDGDQASHTVPKLASMIAQNKIIRVRIIVGVLDNSSSIHLAPYQNEKWLTKIYPPSTGKDAVDITLCVKAAQLHSEFYNHTAFFVVTNDHFGTALSQEIEELERPCFLIRRDEDLDIAVLLLAERLQKYEEFKAPNKALQDSINGLNAASFTDPSKSSLINTLGNHNCLPTILQKQYIRMLSQKLGMTEDFMDRLKESIPESGELQVSWIGNQFRSDNARWVDFLSRHAVQLFLDVKLGRSKTGSFVLRRRSTIENNNQKVNAVIERPSSSAPKGKPIDWEKVTTTQLRGLYDMFQSKKFNSHREFCNQYTIALANFKYWRHGKRECNRIRGAMISFLKELELTETDLLDLPPPNANNSYAKANVSANNNNSAYNVNKRKREKVGKNSIKNNEPVTKAAKTIINPNVNTNENYLKIGKIYLRPALMQGQMYHLLLDFMPNLFEYNYLKAWQPHQAGQAVDYILDAIVIHSHSYPSIWQEFFNALDSIGLIELRRYVFGGW